MKRSHLGALWKRGHLGGALEARSLVGALEARVQGLPHSPPAGKGEPRSTGWFRLGPGHFPDTGRPFLSNTILWCLGGLWGDGNRSRARTGGRPAEFPGVLHEGEVPLDEGEEAGGELHCGRGEKIENKNFSKNGKQNEGEVAPLFSPFFFFRSSLLSQHTREQGHEEARSFFQTSTFIDTHKMTIKSGHRGRETQGL